MMNYLKSLFQGRINRRNYIVWVLIVYILVSLLTDFMGNLGPLVLILYLALAILTTSAAVRRLHDFNKSGWFALLFIVPLVNIILALFLIFKKGDTAKNKYGPEPKARLGLQSCLNINNL